MTSVQEENEAETDKDSQNDFKTRILSPKTPNTIRKKPSSSREERERTEVSDKERGRFPVRPHQDDCPGDKNEIWQKYHGFLEADQAGPGTIVHDHTVNHKIVVIKEIKLRASKFKRQQLYKVLNKKNANIVCLINLFLSDFSVHAVYEPLKTSMHLIHTTSRQEVTEIKLAIFSKGVRATACPCWWRANILLIDSSGSPLYPQ